MNNTALSSNGPPTISRRWLILTHRPHYSTHQLLRLLGYFKVTLAVYGICCTRGVKISPLPVLAASADHSVVGNRHGQDAVVPHCAQEVDGLLPLAAALARADYRRVYDRVRCQACLAHALAWRSGKRAWLEQGCTKDGVRQVNNYVVVTTTSKKRKALHSRPDRNDNASCKYGAQLYCCTVPLFIMRYIEHATQSPTGPNFREKVTTQAAAERAQYTSPLYHLPPPLTTRRNWQASSEGVLVPGDS